MPFGLCSRTRCTAPSHPERRPGVRVPPSVAFVRDDTSGAAALQGVPGPGGVVRLQSRMNRPHRQPYSAELSPSTATAAAGQKVPDARPTSASSNSPMCAVCWDTWTHPCSCCPTPTTTLDFLEAVQDTGAVSCCVRPARGARLCAPCPMAPTSPQSFAVVADADRSSLSAPATPSCRRLCADGCGWPLRRQVPLFESGLRARTS